MVINAIRKEEGDKGILKNLRYQDHLWLEKEIKTVANITARDVDEFFDLAVVAEIKPEYREYPLSLANEALREMKEQKIQGAKVLRIKSTPSIS